MSKNSKKARNTVLPDHKKVGSKFIPPILQFTNMSEVKWLDTLLPQLIWLSIFNDRFGKHGIEMSVGFAKSVNKYHKTNAFNWLALIGSYYELTDDKINTIIKEMDKDGKLSDYKSALEGFILLYPDCPLNFIYDNRKVNYGDNNMAIDNIKRIIKPLYNKLSQQAVFMQAAAIAIAFETDILKIAPNITLAKLPLITSYPNTRESKEVAAVVRSTITGMAGAKSDNSNRWAAYFWNRGLELEPCES